MALMKTVNPLLYTIVLFFVAGYFLFVGFLFLKQRDFLYAADRSVPDIKTAPWATLISVTTDDNLGLNAWWAAPQKKKPTIIFFHGNGSNIGNRIWKSAPYVQAGYGFLLAEYRGYGGNPGKASEQGLYQDARAYIDWMINNSNIHVDDIILYGESLGSGISIQMATEYNVKGVILDVPFLSVLSTAKHHYPYIPFMQYLLRDHYRSDLKIHDVKAPILFGIAGRDRVIPPEFGKQLYELAPKPKTLKIYPDAGHADLYVQGFTEDSIEFIEGL